MSATHCDHCGEPHSQPIGAVNRALRKGAPIYCGKVCAGLARRKGREKAELVEMKRLYDIEYRAMNLAKIKAAKAENFRKNYDPVAAKVERKKRYPYHLKYLQSPRYRAYKQEYDRRYKARKDFGEFWEASILLSDVTTEVLSRQSRYEIMLENGTYGKSQKRRRDYDRLISNQS